MKQLIVKLFVATSTFITGVAVVGLLLLIEPTTSVVEPVSISPASVQDIEPPSVFRCPPSRIFLGIIDRKALVKPTPLYPAFAKSARLSGQVIVQVVVDESGRVISAVAVSGHPLLQQTCVEAAFKARFSPVLLSGGPIRVSGLLTYRFE